MRAVRLAEARIAVGAGCSLDAWTIAVARFSRGSSAILPAGMREPTKSGIWGGGQIFVQRAVEQSIQRLHHQYVRI
jgi:hypothetical protein